MDPFVVQSGEKSDPNGHKNRAIRCNVEIYSWVHMEEFIYGLWPLYKKMSYG